MRLLDIVDIFLAVNLQELRAHRLGQERDEIELQILLPIEERLVEEVRIPGCGPGF